MCVYITLIMDKEPRSRKKRNRKKWGSRWKVENRFNTLQFRCKSFIFSCSFFVIKFSTLTSSIRKKVIGNYEASVLCVCICVCVFGFPKWKESLSGVGIYDHNARLFERDLIIIWTERCDHGRNVYFILLLFNCRFNALHQRIHKR